MVRDAKQETGQRLARFLLWGCDMRKLLFIAMAWVNVGGSLAHAVELRSELAVGKEFVYVTNGAETELLDGQLGIGAGLTMVSDYATERYGAHGLIEYRGAYLSAGVTATFGPRQQRRSWASVDPHAELHVEGQRWSVRADTGVLLRRIDVAAPVGSISVDQLQLHVGAQATIEGRWRVGALALYSFYDPSPAGARLRDLDLGLAVTLAGRPERWAAGAHAARRLSRPLWLELGITGVVYANGRGSALVPRAGLLLGPWRGISIGASVDLVADLDPLVEERVRAIGGLELEYER
ncbi:MAG: hypothetical protein JWN44_2680 [Myxococcales bacterium]|nr:hypothetical protein [Myxococcales bacterium]